MSSHDDDIDEAAPARLPSARTLRRQAAAHEKWRAYRLMRGRNEYAPRLEYRPPGNNALEDLIKAWQTETSSFRREMLENALIAQGLVPDGNGWRARTAADDEAYAQAYADSYGKDADYKRIAEERLHGPHNEAQN